MNRVGVIGIVAALLLVLAATPVMAAEVSVNTTDPTNLTLFSYTASPSPPAVGIDQLDISATLWFNNTNLTADLTADDLYLWYLSSTGWVNTQLPQAITIPANNTSYEVTVSDVYTLTAPGVICNLTFGNSTDWLPNTTGCYYAYLKSSEAHSYLDLGISRVKAYDPEDEDYKVNAGETIKIEVVWSKMEGVTRYFAVVPWTKYKEIRDSTGITSVADVLDKAEFYDTLPEDAGNKVYELSFTEPGVYVLVFVNASDPSQFWDEAAFVVEPAVAGKPTVSISVDRGTVAIGDYIKVKASMSTNVPVSVVKVFVTGSGMFLNETGFGMLCIASGGQYYTVKDACGKDSWWVKISDVPEGVYVAKIDVGEGPTRAEAVALFTVEKPKITSLNVPSTHVKGTDLVIEGTCNLAKSGEKADNATIAPQVENWAYLTIEDLAGNVVVNSTITSAATSYIDSGGKFRFKIDDFGKDLSTGYYKVTVMIDSGIKTDDETAIMEIVKPEIKLTADKYMATRGSTVTFTIDTNLKVNNPVVFKIENTEFCTGDPDCVAEKEYKVDVRGDVIIKLTVNTMAPLTDYKFRAEIPDLGVSDEVRVTVVKQELNLTAEKTVVVRGGDVRFTGSTTADVVYVYADEPGIFRIGSVDVAELPSDTILTGDQLKTAVVYPDSNDRLDFKVDVLVTHPEYGDVSPGTYYLYFYAPANVTNGVANQIDRASDAQAIVAVTVTDPKIVSVDIPSRIPYQGKVEVSILTAPGDRNNVEVTFKLEGSNIKARPDDFDLPTYQTPDANNYVNFTLDLSKYAEKKGETLEPGLYVFTVELRFTQELGGDEVDSKDVLVEVVPQTLDVEIQPAQPVVGDKITVTVSTNREGVSGYDHIWVTMVGTNYKSVQRVTLDSTGKGSVTFETVGLAPGTYKFYIRDTSGTVAEKTEVELVEDLYDLDPADPVARVYNAHDDLVVVRTIELLETAPTTTTTPTPTPTQTTTTVATTPTTTTTEVTTTTPTTTTTPGGGIPGFEAIFAIAGLLAVAYLLRRR